MFIVISPNDIAYGPFSSYEECYAWAEERWGSFSIYEVHKAVL